MPDGKRPKPQHAPKAPHEDPKFLSSTPARPIRIIAEYIHPLVQLKNQGIGDTIVMFGSARIESHETASARYTRLKKWKTSGWSAERLNSRILTSVRSSASTFTISSCANYGSLKSLKR